MSDEVRVWGNGERTWIPAAAVLRFESVLGFPSGRNFSLSRPYPQMPGVWVSAGGRTTPALSGGRKVAVSVLG